MNSVAQIASTDAGVSWSEPTRVGAPTPQYPTGPAPTSGNGIQLRDGFNHAGRLIFSMDTEGYTGDELLLSDNHGAAYNTSYGINKPHMNEVQMVQLGNGSVMAVMRNNAGKQPS
jgi:hypothetical protein